MFKKISSLIKQNFSTKTSYFIRSILYFNTYENSILQNLKVYNHYG